MKRFFKKIASTAGYEIHRKGEYVKPEKKAESPVPFFDSCPDFSEEQNQLISSVKEYTMTSKERLYALINAIEYVESAGIEGAIVECGVWRGGGMMLAAKTLLKNNSNKRELFLYDTFEEGMTEPDATKDISITGGDAKTIVTNWEKSNSYPTLEEVQKNMFATGYDRNKIKFVKGDIMNTLKTTKPKSIAVLRLDTDWYNTTKYELMELFPLLSDNGILIIDDYGHWQGAKQAVDEYFSENKIHMYLHRVDYTCRLGIKTKKND